MLKTNCVRLQRLSYDCRFCCSTTLHTRWSVYVWLDLIDAFTAVAEWRESGWEGGDSGQRKRLVSASWRWRRGGDSLGDGYWRWGQAVLLLLLLLLVVERVGGCSSTVHPGYNGLLDVYFSAFWLDWYECSSCWLDRLTAGKWTLWFLLIFNIWSICLSDFVWKIKQLTSHSSVYCWY